MKDCLDIYENPNSRWSSKLSTFYPCLIIYNDKEYPTVEHLYQSLRYLDSDSPVDQEYAEMIRQVRTPYAARLLGDQYILNANMKWANDIAGKIRSFRRKGLRSVGNCDHNYLCMKMATCLKLDQHPEILDELRASTGKIIYHSRYSSKWGVKQVCVYNKGSPNAWYEPTGHNRYGKLLRELRDEIDK